MSVKEMSHCENQRKGLSLFWKLFVIGFALHCGTGFSPKEECFSRNRCDKIEGECYLRNLAIYQASTGDVRFSAEDSFILYATCNGLGDTCKRNCQSSTIF